MFVWEHPGVVCVADRAAFINQVSGRVRQLDVVVDEHVEEAIGIARQFVEVLRSSGTVVADPLLLPPSSTIEQVRLLSEALTARRAPGVLALGGGATLDTVKLASASVDNPSIIEDATFASETGLVHPTLDRRSRRMMFAVPTTVGTGSEVSPSACVFLSDGAKRLVQHPNLRPDVALLDPTITASTPRHLILEGAFETLMRCIGPIIGGSLPQPVSDELALALGRLVVAAGNVVASRRSHQVVDDREATARHEIAQLSAATHTNWILVGRGRFSHLLWYLANDVSGRLRVSKIAATAALFPTYVSDLLQGHVEGCPPGTVIASLLEGVIDDRRSESDLVGSIVELQERWGLPTSLLDIGGRAEDVPRFAEDVVASWGSVSGALRDLNLERLEALYAQALSGPQQSFVFAGSLERG